MDANQKSGLPVVASGNGETNLTIADRWFMVDVAIFNSRVFCFVGTRKSMRDTAYAGISALGQVDAADRAKFVEEYAERNGPEFFETGDTFGEGGNAYIRISKMYVGALDDILVLSHECLHSAIGILRNAGIEEGGEQEVLCYTHQYILGEFMKQMLMYTGFKPLKNPNQKG